MLPTVFSFDDYKTYLASCVRAAQPSRGFISRMAEAAGCQRSYLSRALGGEIHLIPDHAYNLAKFLALNETETEYLLTLLELDRAASASYKSRLKQKLARIRQDHEDLQNKVNRTGPAISDAESFYYSDWLNSALHIIVSIPQFQTARAIAEHLHLPMDLVEARLRQLQESGFVRLENKRWLFSGRELHVRKDSPYVTLHHGNWRQRAVLNAQLRQSEDIHFTVIQSVDAQSWQKIRQKLLSFIEEASRIAGPAKEEKLICFACDLFAV